MHIPVHFVQKKKIKRTINFLKSIYMVDILRTKIFLQPNWGLAITSLSLPIACDGFLRFRRFPLKSHIVSYLYSFVAFKDHHILSRKSDSCYLSKTCPNYNIFAYNFMQNLALRTFAMISCVYSFLFFHTHIWMKTCQYLLWEYRKPNPSLLATYIASWTCHIWNIP